MNIERERREKRRVGMTDMEVTEGTETTIDIETAIGIEIAGVEVEVGIAWNSSTVKS